MGSWVANLTGVGWIDSVSPSRISFPRIALRATTHLRQDPLARSCDTAYCIYAPKDGSRTPLLALASRSFGANGSSNRVAPQPRRAAMRTKKACSAATPYRRNPRPGEERVTNPRGREAVEHTGRLWHAEPPLAAALRDPRPPRSGHPLSVPPFADLLITPPDRETCGTLADFVVKPRVNGQQPTVARARNPSLPITCPTRQDGW